jgi:hypothetical protein
MVSTTIRYRILVGGKPPGLPRLLNIYARVSRLIPHAFRI